MQRCYGAEFKSRLRPWSRSCQTLPDRLRRVAVDTTLRLPERGSVLNRRVIRLLTIAVAVLQLLSAVVGSAGLSTAFAGSGERTVQVPICHKGGEPRTVAIVLPVDATDDESGGIPGCLFCTVHCNALAVAATMAVDPFGARRYTFDAAFATKAALPAGVALPWQARAPPAVSRPT